MSPPGALDISPQLEAMRLKYAIPDAAFSAAQCVYDRCLLWQINQNEPGVKTYGDTKILMPETAQKATAESSPRAVIIGVGLAALDAFRDNGCEIGDVVWFLRLSPYRIPVAVIDGHQYYAILCRAGDIIANESLAKRMTSGDVKLEVIDGQHCLRHPDKSVLTPSMPRIPADY